MTDVPHRSLAVLVSSYRKAVYIQLKLPTKSAFPLPPAPPRAGETLGVVGESGCGKSTLAQLLMGLILNLLAELQRSRDLTYILISHNVSVVRHMADRVAVMYLGQIVELGSAAEVLERPRHPYTQLLLEAVPRLGVPVDDAQIAAPTELPGNRNLPTGCFFRDRCPKATVGCEQPQALLPAKGGGELVRCHLAQA